MGYTITIGQLVIEKSPEDGLDCSCINFSAELIHHDDGPAFGEPTDHENQRWPSYSSWSEFAKDSGLYSVLFYESGHLIGGHPGIRLVTPELVKEIGRALAAYRARYPEVNPEFNDDPRGGTLCRLIWLDYWVRWALENCETPVIANR